MSVLKQYKRLAQDTTVYGGAFVIRRMLGILFIPIYTRFLLPADYGIFQLAAIALQVVLALATLGVQTGLNRATRLDARNEDERDRIRFTALVFVAVSSAIWVVATILFRAPLAELLFKSRGQAVIVLILSNTLWATAVFQLIVADLRARADAMGYSRLILMDTVLVIILQLTLVVGLRWGARGALLAGSISLTVITLLCLPRYFRCARRGFSWKWLKFMLAFSAPLTFSALTVLVLTMADRVFLRFMLGDMGEVGLYSNGAKVAMLLSMAIMAFGNSWMAAKYDFAKHERSDELYSKTFTYYVLLMGFLALCLAVLSREVVCLMVGEQFRAAWTVTPILVFGLLIDGVGRMLGVGVAVKKKTWMMPAIYGPAAVANLLLNWLLIPLYGRVGAAAATLISYGIAFTGFAIARHKVYPFTIESRRILKILLVACVVVWGAELLAPAGQWNGPNAFSMSWGEVLISFAVKGGLLVVFFPLLYLCGFFTRSELRAIRSGALSVTSRLMQKLRERR